MKTSYRLSEAAFRLDGKMPLKQAIPLGLQHVLAMFVGNLTPLLIITGACGIAGGEFADLQLQLLQNAMLVAGIVTLVQLFAIGPVGGKVPIIMGTSSGFIGVFNSVAATMGGGVLAYGAIMGASIIGGLFETVLGFFLKPLRKFFPSVVTGTVVMSIGLSLISVGINSFGGGNTAKDFGSMENLLLALFVLVMILVFKHATKGFASFSAILLGIICGYVAAFIMGFVLPTTGVTADGVEYTKAWVLNWQKVADASWFAIPTLMPVKPVFDLRAILPVLIMFVVTALFVLVMILVFKHATKGFASFSAILLGIICGYVAAFIMGFVLPTTGVTADGVEYTKAWVLNWQKVADASWFAIPTLMPVKPVFDLRAILPVLIMFVVTAVETVGDISGVMEGGLGREATDTELSGGVMCDGLGSSFAALFGVLPNTSFSQNVGLVSMTKIVNRFALSTGAIFLILCGLCPKLGAIVSIMPQSVLGGAAVMMFSSIVISGIQLITKEPLTARNLSIVSVALGVGYGMGANASILNQAPQAVQLIFGGSGIVPAALVAIVLNILLPKEKKEDAAA